MCGKYLNLAAQYQIELVNNYCIAVTVCITVFSFWYTPNLQGFKTGI